MLFGKKVVRRFVIIEDGKANLKLLVRFFEKICDKKTPLVMRMIDDIHTLTHQEHGKFLELSYPDADLHILIANTVSSEMINELRTPGDHYLDNDTVLLLDQQLIENQRTIKNAEGKDVSDCISDGCSIYTMLKEDPLVPPVPGQIISISDQDALAMKTKKTLKKSLNLADLVTVINTKPNADEAYKGVVVLRAIRPTEYLTADVFPTLPGAVPYLGMPSWKTSPPRPHKKISSDAITATMTGTFSSDPMTRTSWSGSTDIHGQSSLYVSKKTTSPTASPPRDYLSLTEKPPRAGAGAGAGAGAAATTITRVPLLQRQTATRNVLFTPISSPELEPKTKTPVETTTKKAWRRRISDYVSVRFTPQTQSTTPPKYKAGKVVPMDTPVDTSIPKTPPVTSEHRPPLKRQSAGFFEPRPVHPAVAATAVPTEISTPIGRLFTTPQMHRNTSQKQITATGIQTQMRSKTSLT